MITRGQLNQAIEKQKLLKRQESLGDVLVSMGIITEKDRIRGLAEQWGVPFVDVSEVEIDLSLIKLVPENVARKLKALPIGKKNGKLTLVMRNPLDIFAIDEVRMMTGIDVEPAIASEEDIINAIGRLYRKQINVSEQVDSVIKEFDTGDINFGSESSGDDEDISIEQLRELSEEAPVIKLANLIISRGISDGGSDIHIEPAKDCVRVRLRVDGILQEIMRIPKKVQASLISRFKIMSEMDIATKRSPQDGRIGAVIDGRQFDFRVSTLPSVFGEKIVLRILDKGSVSVGLHKLGMLPETLERFEGLISRT